MPELMHIHTIVSAPFEENTYVVWLAGGKQGLVIDPGLEPELILDFLRAEGLVVAAILNTHGHADHIGGNEALKDAFPDAPLIIGVNDAPMLGDANANLSAPFGLPITSPPANQVVREGDVVAAAGIRLEVLDVPGHSPGHQSLAVETKDGRVILGGQAVNFSSDYARQRYSLELARRGEAHGPYPEWMARIFELDPWRVYFAHDTAHWEGNEGAPIG